MTRRRVPVLLAMFVLAAASAASAQTTDFARLVARLSEDGGHFDSDNLVSNETSYLHVLPGLRARGVRGGAYIGVGPEQSFSYLAAIEPEVALIIDIRRDNMLLHLLLKAMFEAADDRLEYLGLLFGRPAVAEGGAWPDSSAAALLTAVERSPLDTARYARTHAALMARVTRFGVPLSDLDRATLRRFHDQFAAAGPALTFTSLRGPPRRAYPSMRRIYLETDLDGDAAGYLTSEARWRRVREMQTADRIVPVVGDLAGPRAMRAIGDWLRERGRTVSALYVSNVEMYLWRDGGLRAFAANVRALPATPSSVIIRSYFGRGQDAPPVIHAGHFSAQLLMSFPRFLALADTASYWALVTDTLP